MISKFLIVIDIHRDGRGAHDFFSPLYIAPRMLSFSVNFLVSFEVSGLALSVSVITR
jgi:hypothetical protein